MLKKLIFRGHLEALYPTGILVEATSAAEAITGLAQFRGFRECDGVTHSVVLPDFQSPDALKAPTDLEEIIVEPFFAGAGGKKMAWIQIVIGVVLIAFGQVYAVGLLSASMAASVTMAGAMMILGGIVSMLTPQPKVSDTSSTSESSKYLGGNGNTVKVGTRIPLLLGRHKAYGQYLGFNITATNLDDPGPPAAISTDPRVFSASVDSNFVITINSDGLEA